MTKYRCPCCNETQTRKSTDFSSWASINRHLAYCASNNNEYYCDKVYGPIKVTFINEHSTPYLKSIYPAFSGIFRNIRTVTVANPLKWKKEELIEKATIFFTQEGRIPTTKDFMNNKQYPSKACIYDHFSSWEHYLLSAKLPYTSNSYGNPTKGLDNNLYRSTLEAIFCDKFLFKKYKYIPEPYYPNNSWQYDWYIPSLYLYIELAGGLRPERIKEKIALNKYLNRKLLVVTPSDLDRYKDLQEMLSEKV